MPDSWTQPARSSCCQTLQKLTAYSNKNRLNMRKIRYKSSYFLTIWNLFSWRFYPLQLSHPTTAYTTQIWIEGFGSSIIHIGLREHPPYTIHASLSALRQTWLVLQTWRRFLRRFRSHITLSLSKERVRSDLRREPASETWARNYRNFSGL